MRGGYGVNPHLQRAWDKYGEDNFQFVVLKECDEHDDLNALEIQYINEFKSQGLSYNIGAGGEGGHLLGKHMPEETKRKIGEKNREHMTGRKASEETRRKMSESQKARFAGMTDEERAAYGKHMAEIASGYTWSDEAKQRFSEKQSTRPNSAKYTIDQVREVRKLREREGLSYKEIASKLGMNERAVYLIATYRRWKNA